MFISETIGLNLQPKNRTLTRLLPRTEDIDQLAEWMKNDQLLVPIDSETDFNEAGVVSAFDKLKSRRVRGKVVILVSHSN